VTGAHSLEHAEIWVKDEAFIDSVAGTVHFLAPECLERAGTEKSDYWSMGVILFRLSCGYFPHK